MATSTTTSIKLDPDTRERLQHLANSRDRTPHYLMREAIRLYLDREEALDEARQAAVAAWNAFEAAGLHVTAEAADAWLARLEAGDDADPPECHD